jgi:hypothetical protein
MVAIMSDFSATARKDKIYTNAGTNGETTCDINGKSMIDFVVYNNLKTINILFQRKDSHK